MGKEGLEGEESDRIFQIKKEHAHLSRSQTTQGQPLKVTRSFCNDLPVLYGSSVLFWGLRKCVVGNRQMEGLGRG